MHFMKKKKMIVKGRNNFQNFQRQINIAKNNKYITCISADSKHFNTFHRKKRIVIFFISSFISKTKHSTNSKIYKHDDLVVFLRKLPSIKISMFLRSFREN